MESLIHHFKIVTEGYRVPEGEVYTTVESPRGELGCYVVSDGGPKPWRVKFRAPSFVALEATATCMHDALIADMIAIVGSLDGGHGRGRPVTPAKRPRFRREVDRLKRAPTRILGRRSWRALRLAQEGHGGWLPPQALVEVADALELTPA